MDNSKKNSKFPEFLDIEFFQILQDRLAEEFGIGSVITDINGLPLTTPSNFSDFCIIHTRGTEIGMKKCMLCDAYGGLKAKSLKKPIVYRCHAGLIDFASPIIMGDTLVGCFLCGQVLSKKPDEDKFRKIAQEIGVDEDIYIEALKKVKILPYEKIEYIADFVYEISSRISNFTSHQNTGMASSECCRKSIEEFDNFLDRVKNKNLSLEKNIVKNGSQFNYILNKIQDTLFKKFSIDEEKLYQIEENMNIFSNETFKMTEKIKDTGKNFSSFDISKLK